MYYNDQIIVTPNGMPVAFEDKSMMAWVEKQIDRKGDNFLFKALLDFGGIFEGWVQHTTGRIGPLKKFKNGIVDVGIHHLLTTQFDGGTPVDPWYIGLINNSGYSALSDSDTMSSHAGWSEATSYSGSRATWGTGTPSGRAITNATPASFSITGTFTIKGAFLTSNNTIGGTTGTLFSTGVLSSTYPVANTDTFKLIYTVQG